MIVSVFKKKPVRRAALVSDIISTEHDLSCWFWMFVHNRRVSTEIKPQNWTVTRKRFVLNNSVIMIHSECLKLFKYSFLALSSFQRHNDTHTLYSWRGKSKERETVTSGSSCSSNQQHFLMFSCQPTCHTDSGVWSHLSLLLQTCWSSAPQSCKPSAVQRSSGDRKTEQQVTFIWEQPLSLSKCAIKPFSNIFWLLRPRAEDHFIICTTVCYCAHESETLRF